MVALLTDNEELSELAGDMDRALVTVTKARERLADEQANTNRAETAYRNSQLNWQRAVEKIATKHSMSKMLNK